MNRSSLFEIARGVKALIELSILGLVWGSLMLFAIRIVIVKLVRLA